MANMVRACLIVFCLCFTVVAILGCKGVPPKEEVISKEIVYQPINPALSQIEIGKIVYQRYGCAMCHGPNAEGGRKNPNIQTGGVITGLTKVAEGYTKSELANLILEGIHDIEKEDPNGPIPPYRMPGWRGHISERDLTALVAYLFSLMPESSTDDWE
ncbi:MAG: cytochrome c [Candidatus Dadabacteria bacterium]|nr:MAG: cytochrome c [Candidatus Dadabacteria bacterium]